MSVTGDRLPICATCGVQYDHDSAGRDVLPATCIICEDERQYVGYDGQRWTSLAELREQGHSVEIREEIPGLWGLATSPALAIGQRALLVPGHGGTVMWDSVTYIDDDAVDRVAQLGGISAIALSHPHYYSSMVEWSHAFDDAPIYVHERDARWLTRTDNVVLWSGGRTEVLPGRTLLRAGVHFDGGTVMHWADGVDGRGALCAGDIFTVVADRRWVGFMYSYPNLIPEHPDTILRAVNMVAPFGFESLYGAWWDRIITDDAHAAVVRSARRYFEHIGAREHALALAKPGTVDRGVIHNRPD
ncbi:MBL fold metallo-hydrolase [Rhodococcoides fascians]|uniref:MBL fold metallo-hydrolase n=1 Tax=Rhodococcoides fascians TaxID=1828 RepID=UPI00056D774D|nr:MBL fold metallo-hydrolase [Rhodococcus fascians]